MGILVSKPQIIPRILTLNNFPCSSPLSLPSLPSAPQGAKRSSLPSTSQPAKRRKTSCQQPTTSNAIQNGDPEECEKSSYGCACPQVFLNHSGKQKNFVEQLFMDLKRENISCFFDKDPQSLPKGEDFPPRIFEAAEKCRVGVVVLSEEFISSKWPMQELSAFVKAKNSTNPKLIILPLFFGLSANALSQKLQNKDSLKRFWQKSLKDQKREIDLDEWLSALEALRPINGVNYVEQEGEVACRAQIVGHILRCLPPSLKYEESDVQGKKRLCQEVAELFNNTPCRENGVKIAGLYGVGGIGKTTLARVVCNFFSRDFDGRVFHVEFGKETPVKRLKDALRNLTDASDTLVKSVTSIERGSCLFKKMMHGKKVFLAVDNISHLPESIEEAEMYLKAVCSAGTQSMILLTARSSTVLKRFIPEGERSCMHVPSLQEEEAMAVFLRLTRLRISDLNSEAKDIARECVRKCYLSCNPVTYGTYNNKHYHPLALKVFGAYLYDKFNSCADLSRWIDIHNSSCPWRSGDAREQIFSIFEGSFQSLREEHSLVFMLLCLYLPQSFITSEEVLNWLALACSRNVQDIESAVIELKRKGFVESTEESGLRLYIHDLLIEFAANKADGKGRWISLEERDEIPVSLQETLSSDRPSCLAMKINNCHFPCRGFVNVELFSNILVLHLQHMPQLKILNLSPMRIVRSITIVECGGIQEIHGLENLTNLAYFRVEGCHANVRLLGIEHLLALQHLEVHASLGVTSTELLQLGSVRFPPLPHFSNFRSIQFDHIEKGTGRLNLSGCPKLRTIKFSHCNITEIDLSGCLELGTIELQYCENLSELPSLTGLTNLWCLKLEGIHSLKELPSLTGLTKLERLRLEGMHSLKELPSLTGLTKLERLWLEGMHSLKELPSLTGLTNLEWLWLEGIHSLKELPSLTGLTNLEGLFLEGMHSLKELPSLTGLTNLEALFLKGMHSLKELPSLTGLTKFEWLWLEGMHSLKELPSLTGLTKLERVRLEGRQSLKELPSLTGLTNLEWLRLEGMHSLKELPSLTGLTNLEWLWLEGMHSLKELRSLTGLTNLEELFLEGMHSLKELPSLTGLVNLLSLDLSGMHSLKELPSLTGLTKLETLFLCEMHSLKELPSLTGLTELGTLSLERMHSLKELPRFTGLVNLHFLGLCEMHSLKELPSLTGLTKLETLFLRGMHSLKELPSLTELTKLETLALGGMHSLKELPSLTGLTKLEWLSLKGMHSLKELPSLTGLTNLGSLRLEGMHSLKELPSLTGLTNFWDLTLEGMHSLKELPSLTGLTNLSYIRLEGMHSLKELPSLTGLTNLWKLRLKGMHSLKELPSLTGLTKLETLRLEGMHSLKELPSLTGLVNLLSLKLEEMHNLKEFPNLTGLTHLGCLRLGGMLNLKEVPNFTGLSGLEYLALGDGMQCMESRTELSGVPSLGLEEMYGLEDLPNLKCVLLQGAEMHCLKDIPRGLRHIRIWYVGLSDEKLQELQGLPGRCEQISTGVKHVRVWKTCLAEGCGGSTACTCTTSAGGMYEIIQTLN